MNRAKPSTTCGLTGMGAGFPCQETAGWVSGQVWNQTDPFLWSKPGPLAGYPDPLVTLFPPDHEILYPIRIYLYQSILLTGLQYIN